MTRTALLVRCDADEADRIRFEAHREQRTISSYVLNISVRAVAADDRLFSMQNLTDETFSRRSPVVPRQRTAILVRCDVAEAEQIRQAAQRREIPINAFILRSLKSVWNRQVPLRVNAVEAPRVAAPAPGD